MLDFERAVCFHTTADSAAESRRTLLFLYLSHTRLAYGIGYTRYSSCGCWCDDWRAGDLHDIYCSYIVSVHHMMWVCIVDSRVGVYVCAKDLFTKRSTGRARRAPEKLSRISVGDATSLAEAQDTV